METTVTQLDTRTIVAATSALATECQSLIRMFTSPGTLYNPGYIIDEIWRTWHCYKSLQNASTVTITEWSN